MSSELVLVVCAANVCRSPLAELILRRGLAGRADIRIESAGTRVRAAAEICELVSTSGDEETWRSAASSHRSRAVTPELLNDAALILVADREVRSEVVRSVPEVRDRVFTLRDAALLADGFSPDEPTRRAGIVSRFTMHLDRTRALRGRPTSRRTRCRRRPGVDWSSIEDGHGRSARRHAVAVHEVTAAVSAVVAALAGSQQGRRAEAPA